MSVLLNAVQIGIAGLRAPSGEIVHNIPLYWLIEVVLRSFVVVS